MRIIVLGAAGMLGGSIFRFFSDFTDHEVLGTIRNSGYFGGKPEASRKNIIKDVDLSKLNQFELLLREKKPDIVINCVGIIKQLDTESNYVQTIKINSVLPHELANLCGAIGAKLIHFSTDCVFSGNEGFYQEEDLPDATDLYGRSKLLGEVNYENHLTLRTSIIGHEFNRNKSLVGWFLSQKKCVNGYSNAIFSGLSTICVSNILRNIIEDNPSLSGVFHLSADPITKYDLLCLISQHYAHSIEINKDESVRIDRSLDSNRLQKLTDITIPNWEIMIGQMKNEYDRYF